MSILTRAPRALPLTPITAVLSAVVARHGHDAVHGLVPGLLAPPAPDWRPATTLTDGSGLPDLLAAAHQRWGGAPATSAALAWKSYSYWLALPAVLGWASARRFPLLEPADVLVRLAGQQPFLTVGLRRARLAVLPSDPLVAIGAPDLLVVRDEAHLLATLRATLLDGHLNPLSERLRERVRLGRRTLLGSLAAGVVHGLTRARDALPGRTIDSASTLLDALDVADLVSVDNAPDGSVTVQRRTCCLAFTLPQPKVCTGCCLRSTTGPTDQH